MADLTTLARPYAKAAFELAHDAGHLAEWDAMLGLAAAMVEEPAMARLLDHPDVGPSKLANLLADAGGKRFDDAFGRFLQVMAESKRLALLPQVRALFHELRLEAENRMHVRVVSAYALDDGQRQRLEEALKKRFDSDIEMDTEVDESLLGGAVIYARDEVIDGSLRGRLKKMATALGA